MIPPVWIPLSAVNAGDNDWGKIHPHRWKKYGRRMHIDDIYPMQINGAAYALGGDTVMTKLFKTPVETFVTEKTDSARKTRRLYLCSELTLADGLAPGLQLDGDIASFVTSDHGLLPLALYWNRWDIETCFYVTLQNILLRFI